MNIFKHFFRIGYGNVSLDGIGYFKNFPHFPHPFDVVMTKDDADTFYYELLDADGNVQLKCRGWKDRHYLVLNTWEVEMELFNKLTAELKAAKGVDIDEWYVLYEAGCVIVPKRMFGAEANRDRKHRERLQKFLDRLLVDEASFLACVNDADRSIDLERLCADIDECIDKYRLFASWSKAAKDDSVIILLEESRRRLLDFASRLL